jgi:hypothetical protein
MTLNKQGDFTFNHVSQPDDLYKTQSAAQIKADFDSRGNELKITLNALIDSLNATTAGTSGAKSIGAETIAGLSGNDVQTLLASLKNQIDSTVLGSVPDGSITDQKLSVSSSSPVRFGSTTGLTNVYAVTLSPAPISYFDGMAVSVKINVDATGVSTLNVNTLGAKGLKKANGLDVTNLKANGVYTFRYNSTTGNFILQGEGGSGTATAPDILTGKTASTDTGDLTGTMVDRGAMTITPGTTAQTIPVGYHNGSGMVVGDLDLIAANIIPGKNIYGVDGAAVMGKKFASGTLTLGSSISFTTDAGGILSMLQATMTGLTFLPSAVLVVSGAYACTLYPSKITSASNSNTRINSNGTNLQLISPASATNGGFTLPLAPSAGTGSVAQWWAFE